MTITSPGLTVFESLAAALRAGFVLYDTQPEYYLMRIATPAGFGFALANKGDSLK